MSSSAARRRAGDLRSLLHRHGRTLAGAIACALSSAALPLEPAAADDFSDFRIPSNRGLLWTAGLDARASGLKSSVPGSEGEQGTSNASMSTQLSWFSDSDPAFTAFGVGLFGQGDRFHRESEIRSDIPPSTLLTLDENSGRTLNERWALSAAHRRYPWAMPFGIEVALAGSGNYVQSWNDDNHVFFTVNPGLTSQTSATSNLETWRYFYSFTGSASVGWGRVRNATGIYDALVLERRLLETGALTRALSPEGRRRLADVLYLRGSLDDLRERPGRTLWGEIERVLAEDGALREGGLDPYSVLRAAEPHLGASGPLTSDGVPASPISRQSGGFVGASVQAISRNQIERNDGGASFETIQNGVVINSGSSTSSNRLTDRSDQVRAGPVAELHLPIGPPWQLDGSGVVLLGLRKQDSDLLGGARLSLTWLAADRWTANGFTQYSWFDENRNNGATTGDNWQFAAGLGASWYFEDHTAFQVAGTENQFWSRQDNGTHFARGLSATVGITYRFSGWFATPGFFPATAARLP